MEPSYHSYPFLTLREATTQSSHLRLARSARSHTSLPTLLTILTMGLREDGDVACAPDEVPGQGDLWLFRWPPAQPRSQRGLCTVWAARALLGMAEVVRGGQ